MLLCDETATQLRARETPPLAPKAPWDAALSQRLQSDDETLFGSEIVRANASSDNAQRVRRALCRAALFLWNDDLDAAHEIVQPLESNATANFLHAVIHRREADFPNARYWWRKAGPHPILCSIGPVVREIDGAREYSLFGRDDFFDAAEFTRLCETLPQNENESVLRRIQAAELEGIYKFCRTQLP